MQGVFTAIEQVVRNTVQTMQVPVRTAESRATTAMKAFLQLRPPTFKGEPDPLVAEDWLEQVTRALDTILVTEEDLRVLFASYQLQEDALQWWKIMEEVRGGGHRGDLNETRKIQNPKSQHEGTSNQSEGRSFKKPRTYTAQQQYPTRSLPATSVISSGQTSRGGPICFGCHQPGHRNSGLPTERSSAAVAAGGTISHPSTGTITSHGATYLLSVWSGGSYQSTVHAEGEQSGSYGIAITYSVSSGLEDYSSIYISTDFISIQTTGCSSAGSEDARTGLRYNISSGTVRDSWTAGAAIGYLCCARKSLGVLASISIHEWKMLQDIGEYDLLLGETNEFATLFTLSAEPSIISRVIEAQQQDVEAKTICDRIARNVAQQIGSVYEEESHHEELNVLSFDAAVLSMSRDLDHLKEVPEEEQLIEALPSSQNGSRKGLWHEHDLEIQEEPQISKYSGVNGSSLTNPNENAVTRETEGEFRLLGRREGGRLFGVEELEQRGSRGRRISFSMEDHHNERASHTLEPGNFSAMSLDDDEYISDGEYDDRQDSDRREPELVCRHLDHVNMLGLNKTALRLRFLVNWLVTSLLQLRLPASDGNKPVQLVHIYGPKIKYERGAAVAFNVRDKNRVLINPELFQKLAETNGISVGIGILSHIRILDSPRQQRGSFNLEDTNLCRPKENGGCDGKSGFIRVEVVTASLGFLTDFNDVYKLWAFVAKFLNPAFINEGGVPSVGEDSET
ncbi:pyridoxal phosphate (PLP)-dependent transferases superfamily protein [Actinidia rufa]|uniref:Pyridoxal phosphate (PLP)-dependent transferases superfamily protein n=1 Tax=Actinidia rufa TaxID=165716 RepID=A0A7J0EQM3_9ERIC|nr:pyridoxal phosphate (PLP)-dependent transferases superfamily protein [Actinidia rufa]